MEALLFCSAHGPLGRTLRKTKGIFSDAHVVGKNIESEFEKMEVPAVSAGTFLLFSVSKGKVENIWRASGFYNPIL